MAGGLFVEVGLMLVEGRMSGGVGGGAEGRSAAGPAKHGPHCPQMPPAQHPVHQCTNTNNLCARAENLRRHMSLLSENCVPMCIDVFLCPECACGQTRAGQANICSSASPTDLLIEQWTVSFLTTKPGDCMEVDGRGLLQAIRSQLHFSQLSAWYSLGRVPPVCYRLSHPDTASSPPFSRPPHYHHFPIALPDPSRPTYLKVSVKSLPRLESVPVVCCPIHSNPSPLASTVTAFRTVFAGLGHCLLDPPSRMPLKQGFLNWRDKRSQHTSAHQSAVNHARLTPSSRNNKPHSHLGVVDDRMQCGCKHIGKHHCEDDLEQDLRNHDRTPLIINGCAKERAKSPSSPHRNNDLIINQQCEEMGAGSGRETGGRTGGLQAALQANIVNPLKRKRHQVCHNTKKLLSDHVRLTPTTPAPILTLQTQLVNSFKQLDIRDVTIHSQEKDIPARNKVPFPCPLTPPPTVPKKSTWTDSSSDDTECESPVSKGLVPPAVLTPQQPFHPLRYRSQPLLGNFEENLLKGRLKPMSVVSGFTADLGASGSFCPKHLSLPVTVSYFPPQGLSTPLMGSIRLSKKGYTVPRSGTIQVTVFNPLGTVVKMFVVAYDLTDMPANSQTFIRQRTVSLDGQTPGKPLLRYLINLRFSSSKSGRIAVHSEIQMVMCRQYDVDATLGIDSESNSHLQSSIITPSNPKFSPRK